MAGRSVSIGKVLNRELADASSLTSDNLVLQISGGKVAPCNNTNRPYSIAYKSTQDRLALTIGNTVFLTGAQLNDPIGSYRSGISKLNLDVNHLAISIGDMLIVGASDDGRVVKGDPTVAAEFARRVGWAEEAVAVSTANTRTKATILAALDIRGGAP